MFLKGSASMNAGKLEFFFLKSFSLQEVARNAFFYLSNLYLFFLLFLPRIGNHLKYSELLLPFLTLFLVGYASLIRDIFGKKLLFWICLFFGFVLFSNFLSFTNLGTELVYLILLPVRYIEIILPLFAFSVIGYFFPKRTIKWIKSIFILLIVYFFLNLFLGFQKGFYGLVVLPGERGPNQVGIVFGLYAVFFLFLYMSRKYIISNAIKLQAVSKWSLSLFLFSSFLVLLNVQRTSIVALIFTTFLTVWIVLLIKKRAIFLQNVKLISVFLIIGSATITAVTIFGGKIVDTLARILYRFQAFEASSNTRFTRWEEFFNFEVWNWYNSFFGVGMGAHNYFNIPQTFTLSFDSLPLRLVFELGLFGLAFFLIFHFYLLVRVYKSSKILFVFSSLVMLFMAGMSITFEAPFVYVPGSIFYTFLGISLGISRRHMLAVRPDSY